jgi:hypothetical protein
MIESGKKYKYHLIAVAFIFLLLITDSMAQPPGGGGGGPPPGAPIDGGVTILAALGIGYGVRKLYKMDRNRGE